MKRRYIKKDNILLVNITRLGDMLQATPTIVGMKLENPNCRITVLVEKQFEDICHYLPGIDEVVSIDLSMTVRCLAREGDGIVDAYEYLSTLVDKLRAQKFDYCLNMSSSAYTAILLKLVNIERSGGWTSDEEGFRIIQSDWARLFATSVFHQNRQFNSLNLVDVFRCSADVEEHPHSLRMNVSDEHLAYADELIAATPFTNTGPLICLQAGASQEKRQWLPVRFIQLAKILIERYNARLVLTGSDKEKSIIDPIIAGVNSPNCVSFAGRTKIPQLAAVLKRAKVLITGDTGPMHVSVAVGTPVVSMFLASAFGFETGPYGEGHIVLQPVIGCGPCNPNKPCARPDCHDQIDPEIMATLAMMRAEGPITSLPAGFADARKVIVYRSEFDTHGFLDFRALNEPVQDPFHRYRAAYRKLWLQEIAGFEQPIDPVRRPLAVFERGIEGIEALAELGTLGTAHIDELIRLIKDPYAAGKLLGEVNAKLAEVDRTIEEKGFHFSHLGPLSRMFIFAKENISGTDPLELASQMRRIYEDLTRRAVLFSRFYNGVTTTQQLFQPRSNEMLQVRGSEAR
jgi:ADP-heptose:LPS heptosyltransferase